MGHLTCLIRFVWLHVFRLPADSPFFSNLDFTVRRQTARGKNHEADREHGGNVDLKDREEPIDDFPSNRKGRRAILTSAVDPKPTSEAVR